MIALYKLKRMQSTDIKVGDLSIKELQKILDETLDNKLGKLNLEVNEKQDLVSIQEAVKITNLAKPTIYTMVHERRIPFIKREGSKKLYFSRKELLLWILGKKNEREQI